MLVIATTPTGRGRRKSATRARQARPPDRGRIWTFAALGILLLVSWLRVMHLGFPLERDEGEFGYIAQEMLRGVPMYDSAHTQKLPGTYLLYVLFLSIFGQSIPAIHIGLLLTNAAIMWLIFLILRATHDGLAGCLGALVFGVMALSPGVMGFASHATFFVTLFALAGLYAFSRALKRDRPALFFVSGLCYGLAFLMKQSGIFFAPVALLLLAVNQLAEKPRRVAPFMRSALALGAGTIAPSVLTVAYYLAIGKFALLRFWTVTAAIEFSEHMRVDAAVKNLIDGTRFVAIGFEILWALALLGLIANLRDRTPGRGRYLYATFAAASALSVLPGFFFTNHYYIPVLAAIALLIGSLGDRVTRDRAEPGGFARTAGVWALAVIGLGVGVTRYGTYYSGRASDVAVSRWIYSGNPFYESIAIGEYLRRHTAPEDRIAILGSETQILFYAQRRSASRFVNTYFLARSRNMQRELIADIERARPTYIVFACFPMSWALLPNSPSDLMDWYAKYSREHYALEGLLSMDKVGDTLKWGAEARAQPLTARRIEILRRFR